MPRVINRDHGELLVETSSPAGLPRPAMPSAEELNTLYPTFLTRFENPTDLSLQLGVTLDTSNLDPLALLFKKSVEAAAEKQQPEERPRKYKTEMCKYFQLGCCTRADDCTFAHQISELRTVENHRGMSHSAAEKAWSDEQETQIGDPYRQEAQSGDQYESTARLRKYKTEMCKYWQQRTCKRGSQCTFAHSQTELRSYYDNAEKQQYAEEDTSVTPKFSPQLAPKKYKTEMCKFWASGRCKRSHDCTFAHYASELREDSLKADALVLEEGNTQDTCKYWAFGTCKRGEDCPFSHNTSPSAFSTPPKAREGSSLIPGLDPLRARADTGSSGTTQTTVEGAHLTAPSILESIESGDACPEPNDDGGYLPTGLLD
jgi:hypothetical protein